MEKKPQNETAALRRRRLRMWIDANFGGSQAAFINDVSKRTRENINQGEVSSLINGSKSFGEKKARKLEKQGGMPFMWLDDEGIPPEEPTDDDFSMIPQLDLKAGCGNGRLAGHVTVKGGLAFKRSYLKHLGVKEENGRTITSEGESMSPTIRSGRAVLIDISDKEIVNGGVFLILDDDGACILKRLVKEFFTATGKTEWIIRSDNPDKVAYPDKLYPHDNSYTIVGRAKWNDNKL